MDAPPEAQQINSLERIVYPGLRLVHRTGLLKARDGICNEGNVWLTVADGMLAGIVR
jgi:hypothetical protein